jgi:hypothetical protein
MTTTKRTTPFDGDKEFTTEADEWGNKSQTYTADELVGEIGYSEDYYTDKKLQEIADTFAVNLDGDDKFTFNDMSAEMMEDLSEMVLTT